MMRLVYKLQHMAKPKERRGPRHPIAVTIAVGEDAYIAGLESAADTAQQQADATGKECIIRDATNGGEVGHVSPRPRGRRVVSMHGIGDEYDRIFRKGQKPS